MALKGPVGASRALRPSWPRALNTCARSCPGAWTFAADPWVPRLTPGSPGHAWNLMWEAEPQPGGGGQLLPSPKSK